MWSVPGFVQRFTDYSCAKSGKGVRTDGSPLTITSHHQQTVIFQPDSIVLSTCFRMTSVSTCVRNDFLGSRLPCSDLTLLLPLFSGVLRHAWKCHRHDVSIMFSTTACRVIAPSLRVIVPYLRIMDSRWYYGTTMVLLSCCTLGSLCIYRSRMYHVSI